MSPIRKIHRGAVGSAAGAALFCMGAGMGNAQAQDLPSANQFNAAYSVAKQEEVKAVVWKASAALGFSLATGNANFFNLSGGANAVRNDGKNKLTLDLNGVYATTNTPVLVDRNGNGVADDETEIGSRTDTKAGYLLFQGRYDRFFTTNNAGYVKAYVGTDFTAAKKALTGAQLGYSRQLFKTPLHDLQVDIGADYNYTNYLIEAAGGNSNVHIASARLAASYNLMLGENTRFEASAESLINLNGAAIGDRYAQPADATKLNGKLSLTTKVWNRLSFRFGFGVRYDNCPAPNATFKYANFSRELHGAGENQTCSSLENFIRDNIGTLFTAQDLQLYKVRYNQKLDTLTEANLVFNFL